MGSSRGLRLTALLALALLANVTWVQDFADHTDDGCQTETHCVACRTALARIGMPAAVAELVAALVVVGTAAAHDDSTPCQALASDRSSRGPPLPAQPGTHA